MVKSTMKFDKELFKRSVLYNIKTLYRKTLEEATPQQVFQAVCYSVKDQIIDHWMETQKEYDKKDPKMVYYLSMEFLMGRALGNNLINLQAYKAVKEALDELGLDLNVVEDMEPDAALGNGGLGRLAACFLDSLATLGYPAYGCGIRYRYGMFKQEIRDGYQVEVPDNWLENGNPFELRRPEYAKVVKFGGYVNVNTDEKGRNHFFQEGYQSVKAVPFDLPIVGYGNGIVNTLRIWDAEPIECFQLDSFDKGDYQKAVEQQNLARNIVEVLYPNDNHYAGKELRLKQQYFFISASVQEAVEKYMRKHQDIRKFHEKVTFQLNDTHPTVAIPELMRILMDDYDLEWVEAWDVTTKTCAYTNHTIMAEALEKWPIELFSRLLPRIYQIVEEINRRFLEEVSRRYPGNQEKVRKMAIIYDGQVHMARLAIVAGYSVNGVARLHTEILKNQELKDFYEMMPEKFNNKTNGITQRRFLLHANPLLADWVTEHIGDGEEWGLELEEGGLEFLTPYAQSEVHRYRGKLESLASAMDFLAYGSEDELVIMTDSAILSNIDLTKVIAAHVKSGRNITVVTKAGICNGEKMIDLAMKLDGKGNVTDMLVDFAAPADYVASMDIFVVDKKWLMQQTREMIARDKFHMDRDLVLGGWQRGKVSVNVYPFDGAALYNESVEEYFKNSMALIDRDIRHDMFGGNHPIYTKVRDRVPTYYGEECQIANCLAADGCMLEGNVKESILFRQVTIAPGADVENCVIMNDSVVGEGAELKYVILDKDVTVTPGAKLIGTKKSPVIVKRGETV